MKTFSKKMKQFYVKQKLQEAVLTVMVSSWVGQKFPGMRQNEREIKFIRGGDAVRTAGQHKGEPVLKRGP